MGHPVLRTAAWRRLRVEVLARDSWRCQIRGPQCEGRATDVDHVVPAALGGALLDPANLRAACAACNRSQPGARRREQLASFGATRW